MPKTNSQKRIEEITQLHSEVDGRVRKQNAIRIGQLLCEQKDELKHGNFEDWVKENLPFITHRTATDWMNLYKWRDHIKVEATSTLTAANRVARELENGRQRKRTRDEVVVKLRMTKAMRDKWDEVMFELSKTMKGRLEDILLQLAQEKLGYETTVEDTSDSSDEPNPTRIDRKPAA